MKTEGADGGRGRGAVFAVLAAAAAATAAAVSGAEAGARPEYGERAKRYPDARRIELPAPGFSGQTVETALRERRTVRRFARAALELGQLSQLAFAAAGKTGDRGGRAAPSAGALYPFELYILVNRVEDLPAGIYHYVVADHALELVREGEFGEAGSAASLGQSQIGDAAATFALAAVPERCRKKYGERCSRYIPIEAGHISQNIYLQAVSLGLVSGVVGAFDDEAWRGIVGLQDEESNAGGVEDNIPGYAAVVSGNLTYSKGTGGREPRESVLYLHAVGKPRERERESR